MKTYKSYSKSYSLIISEKNSEYRKAKITSSKDAVEFIRQFYGDDIEIYESFFLLLLSRNNTTLGHVKISQGGITGNVTDVKLIAKYAVDCLASGVILAHNHPSGELKPSSADIQVTEKVRSALSYLDVQVLDHVILTANGYTSLADEGQI